MGQTIDTKAATKQKQVAANYQGTRYKEIAEANPYTNVAYEKGIWDKLGNFFGFRTAEDQRREELAQAAAEYNAQIASLKSEDEYNTPEAKAERMRAAGQNPDLLGTEGVEPAAGFNEPETTPEVPGGEQGEQALKQTAAVATSLVTAGTTAIGLLESGINLEMQIANVEAQRIANFENYFNTAKNYVINTLSVPQLQKEREDEDAEYKGAIKAAVKQAEDDAPQLFYNGKQRKRFIAAIKKVTDKLPTTAAKYREWKELEENKQNLGKTIARGSQGSIEDEVKFWEPIEKALVDLNKLQYEFQKKQWGKRNEGELAETEVAAEEAEAGSRKAEAENRQQQAEIDKGINSIWNEAISGADKMCKSQDKRDQRIGYALKIALLIAKSMSISKTSGSSTDRYGRTTTTQGMSIGF